MCDIFPFVNEMDYLKFVPIELYPRIRYGKEFIKGRKFNIIFLHYLLGCYLFKIMQLKSFFNSYYIYYGPYIVIEMIVSGTIEKEREKQEQEELLEKIKKESA